MQMSRRQKREPAGRVQESPRLRKPSWRDPRLLGGVLLVLASVAGVMLLLAQMDKTVGVYAAKHDLAYGQAISQESFKVVQVNLGEAQDHYWRSDEELPERMVATRAVNADELIAKNALDQSAPEGEQALVLSLPNENTSGLQPGDEIEVWVAQRTGPQEYDDPQRIVERAVLAKLSDDQNAWTSSRRVQVTIWLESAQVPQVIKAQSTQSQVYLVGRSAKG